jgi:hypothetical protein
MNPGFGDRRAPFEKREGWGILGSDGVYAALEAPLFHVSARLCFWIALVLGC